MQLGKSLEGVINKGSKLKRWHKIVLALSILVIVFTTYVMIKPAMALTPEQAEAKELISKYEDIVSDTENKKVIKHEKWENGLYWSIVEESESLYSLVITGTGDIPNNSAPWAKEFGDRITKLIIGEGVTLSSKLDDSTLEKPELTRYMENNMIEEIIFPSTINKIVCELGIFPSLKDAKFVSDLEELNLHLVRSDKYVSTLVLPKNINKIYCANMSKNPDAVGGISSIKFVDDKGNLSNKGSNYEFDDTNKILIDTTDNSFVSYFGVKKSEIVLPDTIKFIDGERFVGYEFDKIIGESITNISTFPDARTLIFPSLSLDNIKGKKKLIRSKNIIEHIALSSTKKVPKLNDNYEIISLVSIDFKNPEEIEVLEEEAFRYLYRLEHDLSKYSGLKEIKNKAYQRNYRMINPTIPKGVEFIGEEAFAECGYIDYPLVYNARGVEIQNNPNTIFKNTTFKSIIIGKDVKNIDEAMLQAMKNTAPKIKFEGENEFNVSKSQYSNNPDFTDGKYFADNNGVLYKLDPIKKTASLSFVPDDLDKYTVPEMINSSYKVVDVETYALKDAKALKELNFDKPKSIINLKDYCFGKAKNLEKINGKSKELDIIRIFNSNANIGKNLFNLSEKIESNKANDVNKENITYVKDKVSLSISTKPNGIVAEALPDKNNKYIYYTGQSVPVTFSFSNKTNTAADKVIRIFLEFSNDKGHTNLEVGKEYNIDKIKFKLTKSDEPNIYIFESEPIKKGVTFTSSLEVDFPSPDSNGGICRIWGEILSEAEADELSGKVGDNSNVDYYNLRWLTRPNKAAIKPTTDKNFELIGNGKKNGKGFVSKIKVPCELIASGDKSDEEFRKLSIGLDQIQHDSYLSTIKLDEGMNWNSEFIAAVKKHEKDKSKGYILSNRDKVYYKDSKDARKLAFTMTNADYTSGYDLQYNEEDNTITLVYNNKYRNEKTYVPKGEYEFEIEDSLIEMNLPSNIDEVANKFVNVNTVYQAKYKYAGLVENPPVNVKFKGNVVKNEFVLHKEKNKKADYFGDSIVYKLKAKNKGVLDMPIKSFSDTLNQYLYLSPKDMASIFTGEGGDNVSINISHATFVKEKIKEEEVTCVDGSKKKISNMTDSLNHTYDGTCESVIKDPNEMKDRYITLYKADSKIYFRTFLDGKHKLFSLKYHNDDQLERTITRCLDYVGFIDDVNAVYKITWDYGANGSMHGGQELEFDIPCSVKNTYMLLQTDRPGKYVHNTVTVPTNSFVAMGGNNTGKKVSEKEGEEFSPKYDFLLCHDFSNKGKEVNIGEDLLDIGTMIDYKVKCSHTTNGKVDLLPIVSKLEGTVKLLIPVEENKDNTSLSNLSKTDDGKYYIINKPGTYRNLKNNNRIIDRVIYDDKLDRTIIKSYKPDVTGMGVDELIYKTIIAKDATDKSGRYSYTSWLNDHDSHRLVVGSEGTILDFDKNIIEKRGKSPSEDVVVENDYSGVNEGDKVTYRLELTNTNNYPLELKGNEIYDILPKTYGLWKWDNNLNLEYVKGEGSEINITNKNHWKIVDVDKDTQKIVWDDDFKVSYEGANTLYIYVTLEFPKGDVFNQFDDQSGGAIIENTLYVYDMVSKVYHSVVTPGKVGFQKGVLFTGDRRENVYHSNMRNIFASGANEDIRNKYNHIASRESMYDQKKAIFYLTISNSGNGTLFLDDIEDILPPGFIFQGVSMGDEKSNFAESEKVDTYFYQGDVISNRNSTGYKSDNNNGSFISKDGKEFVILNKDYHIDTEVGDIDPLGQKVKFKISDMKNSKDTISYDEKAEKYYLKKNEAITIVYQTLIKGNDRYDKDGNLIDGTIKESINRTSMSYTDPFNSGVEIDKDTDIKGNKYYIDKPISYTPRYESMPLNDGHGKVIDNATAESYGFDKDPDNRKRLYSDVTLYRGEIIPGIQKQIDKKISTNGSVSDYDGYANYTDTLRWKLRLYNDGDSAIDNLTVEDIVEAPYFFTGKVILDESVSKHKHYGKKPARELFEIKNFEKDNNGKECAIIKDLASKKEHRYEIGSDQITPYNIQITKEKNGNYKLKFDIIVSDDWGNPYSTASLLQEGSMLDVYIETKNITNEHKNHVYTNQANLRVNGGLDYDNSRVSKGQPLADENGKFVKAVANAAVLTSQQTTSVLSIEDKNIADTKKNTARSDKHPNYIIVNGKNDDLNYYMEVMNKSDQSISQMTILNNLPTVNDSFTFSDTIGRNSEFAVGLDASKDIEVYIDGNKISSDKYTVEYSTKKTFNENDWAGKTDGWSKNKSNKANATALRIILKGDNIIPPSSNLKIKVPAKINSNDVVPGDYAWNTFGYRYKTSSSGEMLEAGPGRVGIKMYNVPEINKRLVKNNTKYDSEKDRTFTFLIYEGAKIDNLPLESTAETEKVLKSKGVKYTFYNIPIKKSESHANKILIDNKFSVTGTENINKVSKATNSWDWVDGKTYTVHEIENDSKFIPESFNQVKCNYYTFKYDKNSPEVISVDNRLSNWTVNITKVDKKETSKKLEGAFFGIYGEDKSKASESLESTIADNKLDVEREVEHEEKKYYLLDINKTNSSGNLSFEKLTGENYVIKELKAPNGYVMDSDLIYVSNEQVNADTNAVKLQISNVTYLELPKTGGPGKYAFIALGLGLIAAAGTMAFRKYRKI